MSLTIQQIITDAKQLAARLKERDATADHIINGSQAIIKKVHELKSYEEEVQHLNDVAQQKPHSELIANIQKENRHLRELQQENRELKDALEEHQMAVDHIMMNYRKHVDKQIFKTRIPFEKLYNKMYEDVIQQQAEKIHEMAAVMDQAALIDENRSVKDEEMVARLKIENANLRDMLQISCKYGSHGVNLESSNCEDKSVQTDRQGK